MPRANLINLVVLVGLVFAAPLGTVRADHTPPPDMVVVVGTLQSEAGCPGDWQPECEATAMVYDAENDIWSVTLTVEPENDQDNNGPRYKVALNGTWAENYGAGGVQDGTDIPLVVTAATEVTFTYDHKTHLVADSVNGEVGIIEAPEPEMVGVPGTHQSEAGCSGDWQPDCEATALTFDEEDGVWQGVFEIVPDNDQDNQGPRYKVALNGGWDVNYGLNAASGGADIPLVVEAATEVKFYYDNKSHWATDNFNQVIAVAVGTFQSELGCNNDNDPGCLRSWMQDPGGTGLFVFRSKAIPPGEYEVQAAIGESDAEIYGADGAAGGAAIPFTVEEGSEVYVSYNPETHQLAVSTEGAPRGDLGKFQAQWVTRDTIAWQINAFEDATYRLYFAPQGGLALTPGGVEGGDSIALTRSNVGLPARITIKFPQLLGYSVFKLDEADVARVPEILKGQIAIAALDGDGRLLDATGLQIPGVLDDLFTYGGALGVSYVGEAPTLRVWAPTAQSVNLVLYDSSTAAAGQTVPMTYDGATGVWSAAGDARWTGRYYLYEVQVYVPFVGEVVTNLVTDPYSFSLSTNSLRSQIVNLDDPALKPAGWDDTAKPPLAAPEDIVIYELHVRDFSVSDAGVPEEARGTYRAFTYADSAGMTHLRALAQAGLTHIHLLPVFDFATTDDDKSTWQAVDAEALAALPPDSDQQALAVAAINAQDPFNWGYDPFHYTAPEGSYATDPDGSVRILEFREMVQALNQAGLRVVMDVVYNHTNASGQNAKSVLDKVVPGYYHRLNRDGRVETSTCCQNTATEHAMMEKLMIDSVLTWATAYKVDGFRFDLMGHHMVSNMENLRAALNALTPAANGVDGQQVYVYGEGWNFGEVADNARGKNAVQLNIGGTGIGVFNDRIRDAVRGGGPFGPKPQQGFITGLLTAPNDFDQGDEDEQRTQLLRYSDLIRLGLAGNLADYQHVNFLGRTVPGSRIDYNGGPGGYTQDPQENINYISAHDNETLFDAIQWKAPLDLPMAERVRMNNLGLSIVMLAQGVPFFHAGDDLLRSKSLDGNTYNSGDWYNRLDFTMQSNNWGVGLPNFDTGNWDAMRERLGNPALQAAPADIQAAASYFQEMLAIRKSSQLFRLQTAEQVQQHLVFYNTGPEQFPGVIVMALENTGPERLADTYDRIVVIFNATLATHTFGHPDFAGAAYELHPIQQNSNDAATRESAYDASNGSFTVAGRTAAVFVVLSTETPATDIPEPTAVAQVTDTPAAPAATATLGAEATAVSTPVEDPPSGSSTGLIAAVIAAVVLAAAGLGAFVLRRRRGA